jgi:hypothetical protein
MGELVDTARSLTEQAELIRWQQAIDKCESLIQAVRRLEEEKVMRRGLEQRRKDLEYDLQQTKDGKDKAEKTQKEAELMQKVAEQQRDHAWERVKEEEQRRREEQEARKEEQKRRQEEQARYQKQQQQQQEQKRQEEQARYQKQKREEQARSQQQQQQQQYHNIPFEVRDEFFRLVRGIRPSSSKTPSEWTFTVLRKTRLPPGIEKHSRTRLGKPIDDLERNIDQNINQQNPYFIDVDILNGVRSTIPGYLRMPKFLYDMLSAEQHLSDNLDLLQQGVMEATSHRLILTLFPSYNVDEGFLQVLIVDGRLIDVAFYQGIPRDVDRVGLKGLPLSQNRVYNVALLKKVYGFGIPPESPDIYQYLSEETTVRFDSYRVLIENGCIHQPRPEANFADDPNEVFTVQFPVTAVTQRVSVPRWGGYIVLPQSRSADRYGRGLTTEERQRKSSYSDVCLFWWDRRYGTYMEIQMKQGIAYRVSPAFWYTPEKYSSARVFGLGESSEDVYIRADKYYPDDCGRHISPEREFEQNRTAGSRPGFSEYGRQRTNDAGEANGPGSHGHHKKTGSKKKRSNRYKSNTAGTGTGTGRTGTGTGTGPSQAEDQGTSQEQENDPQKQPSVPLHVENCKELLAKLQEKQIDSPHLKTFLEAFVDVQTRHPQLSPNDIIKMPKYAKEILDKVMKTTDWTYGHARKTILFEFHSDKWQGKDGKHEYTKCAEKSFQAAQEMMENLRGKNFNKSATAYG